MAYAYPTLMWHIREWNIVSYFEGQFAHSIAVIIAHWSMSLALTLYMLKRIKKHTKQTRQDKED